MKVEGCNNYAEVEPDIVALAKKLRRYTVQGRKCTLWVIVGDLSKAGLVAERGKPDTAAIAAKMIES